MVSYYEQTPLLKTVHTGLGYDDDAAMTAIMICLWIKSAAIHIIVKFPKAWSCHQGSGKFMTLLESRNLIGFRIVTAFLAKLAIDDDDEEKKKKHHHDDDAKKKY